MCGDPGPKVAPKNHECLCRLHGVNHFRDQFLGGGWIVVREPVAGGTQGEPRVAAIEVTEFFHPFQPIQHRQTRIFGQGIE